MGQRRILEISAKGGDLSSSETWRTFIEWVASHSTFVSVGGLLTVVTAAFAGHLFTKTRENLKREREHISAFRRLMIEKLVNLLDVTAKARTVAYTARSDLANMPTDDKTFWIGLEANAKILDHAFTVENAARVAHSLGPPDISACALTLSSTTLALLDCTVKGVPTEDFATADADVQRSIDSVYRAIRITYNVELYDSIDPRGITHRIRFGFTETRRRQHRERAAAEVLAELNNAAAIKSIAGQLLRKERAAHDQHNNEKIP